MICNPGEFIEIKSAILNAAKASASTIQLADYLFEMPIISIPHVQRLFGMSYRGAQLVVKRLLDLELLAPAGERVYGKSYIAAKILAEILRAD